MSNDSQPRPMSEAQKEAAAGLELITADDITAFSQADTATFVVLTRGVQTVFPDGETPEHYGNYWVIDMAGDSYAVDPEAFTAAYDLFRRNDGATLYASKAVGDQTAQQEAFLDAAASLSTRPQNEASKAVLSLIQDGEMPVIKTRAQRNISNGARADCSHTGTGIEYPGLRRAA